MAIPFLPILDAISNLATTAWQIYHKSNEVKVQDGLQERVVKLEKSDREQARLLSEATKDLEQFAKAAQSQISELQQLGSALQAELAAGRKRETQARRLFYLALAIAVVSLALAVVALLK